MLIKNGRIEDIEKLLDQFWLRFTCVICKWYCSSFMYCCGDIELINIYVVCNELQRGIADRDVRMKIPEDNLLQYFQHKPF